MLLWHNSSFDPLCGWAGWKEVYERVLEHISEQNAWVTSGREIVEWWQRGASCASPTYGSRIPDAGDGSVRAL